MKKVYSYRIFRKGKYFIYSSEYKTLKNALKWYLRQGKELENKMKRKLVLFQNSRKFKDCKK